MCLLPFSWHIDYRIMNIKLTVIRKIKIEENSRIRKTIDSQEQYKVSFQPPCTDKKAHA